MKISFWNQTAAFSVILILCLPAPSLDAALDLREVQRQINRGEYAAARELINAELPGLSGNALLEAKTMLAGLETDPREAGRLYESISNTDKSARSLRALLELAKISYATGEYREVVAILDKIPSGSRAPERYEALYFKGLAQKEIGDFENAFETFESIDRGDYLFWSSMALAEIDIQFGRIRRAVERYETIAGGHSNPIAGFRLGECYEILGEREKALDVYGNLSRLYPESLEAPQAKEKIQAISSGKGNIPRAKDREGGEREETAGSARESGGAGGQYYALQFGAFSVRKNAEDFFQELKGAIDNLTITSYERGGKVWYRVRAGRYPNREKAEAAARKFMEQTGYSSKVLPAD
ncbi:MAG: SPOR domain-containing protein [Candidatus Krumholzibacteria bacterium]|nr:SPOR domain-containing protein [Candidatus Krumholzibacteria bacterium]